MTAPAPAEAHLSVFLETSGDRVSGVRLESRPGPDVARLLRGRSIAEVDALLPRVFSLCGAAHREAFRRALRGFLPPTSPSLEVEIEGIGEMALRLLIDGAALTDRAPDVTGVRAIRREMAQILAGTGAVATLATPFFGATSPSAFLAFADASAVERWRGENATIPSALLGAALALPAGAPPALPDLEGIDRRDLGHRLEREADFARFPTWGEPRETGPLGWHGSHPLVASCRKTWGDGVATRLVARLVDVAHRLTALPRAPRLPALEVTAAWGGGETRAPRGDLFYAVRTEADRVTDLWFVPPTAWTFHPAGIVARALGAGMASDVRKDAPFWLLVLDPCTPYTVYSSPP